MNYSVFTRQYSMTQHDAFPIQHHDALTLTMEVHKKCIYAVV